MLGGGLGVQSILLDLLHEGREEEEEWVVKSPYKSHLMVLPRYVQHTSSGRTDSAN